MSPLAAGVRRQLQKGRTAVAAARRLGLRTAFEIVQTTVERAWLERRFGAPPPSHGHIGGPGRLVRTVPTDDGTRYEFSAATLDVAFLADDVVRLTWHPGPPVTPYAITTAPSWPRPSDGSMRVDVDVDGAVRIFDGGGRLVREERPPEWELGGWVHRAALREEERVYGLGERAAPLNLRPGQYELWNRDPGGVYGPGADPLYMNIPVHVNLHRDAALLVMFESSWRATVTIGDEIQYRTAGGAVPVYVIVGTLADVLGRYGELVGRAPLPPRWALGYHQSRWGYATQAEVASVVEGFEAHGIPLSAIHLDLDYMDGYRVFTVSEKRFPDLGRLCGDLEQRGVRVVPIVDCGVKVDPDYAVYRDGLRDGRFCLRPDGAVSVGAVWPGRAVFPDFTDPDVRAWWGELYGSLLDAGVGGIWHDMNEPTSITLTGDRTLPTSTRHHMEGRGGSHVEAHNAYATLINRAAVAGLQRARPDRRPFVLSRAGWIGVQRDAWTWTADVESTWAGLRQTVATVVGLGVCGVPYSGADIGGFSGSPGAELYLRWLELSVLLPFCRTHSAVGSARREPWAFDAGTLVSIRELIRLRYRLLPYLYTLAFEASRTGHPLVRPLVWASPSDERLWDVDDSFLLGDALLVAPVLDDGARSRRVVLPEGRWFGFWDDTVHDGGRSVTLDAPLGLPPVLARAGAAVPLDDDGTLEVHAWPADGIAHGTLYWDEGDGYGPFRYDRLTVTVGSGGVDVERATEGDGPAPAFAVRDRAGFGATRDG